MISAFEIEIRKRERERENRDFKSKSYKFRLKKNLINGRLLESIVADDFRPK